jgi:uncharacterized protein (TIGR00730 family)
MQDRNNQKLNAGSADPKSVTKRCPERNVCVFCGSGPGRGPVYASAARAFGASLAEAGIGLVYGGGGLGLMGEVARSVLAAGGYVTGIIPEFLTAKEHMLHDVDELIVTDNMHERKQQMFEHSDAFVALPGGIGTLEELVEQMTWAQLGQHDKPIVLANITNFWAPLKGLLDHMRNEAFIRPGLDVRFAIIDRIEDVVPHLAQSFAMGLGDESAEDLIEKF